LNHSDEHAAEDQDEHHGEEVTTSERFGGLGWRGGGVVGFFIVLRRWFDIDGCGLVGEFQAIGALKRS
jgi:hypothetical protein